ncbi:hypothetical protein L3N51_01483 [Metallosphaera sp. J1]|uniref:AAA family ATPase n=1 Tax=Metallosphaera javensis (ex Hofmann et al. 2022) TaxID=99938 RepID=UPI001EDDFEC1|nr:ATP-binding protein [Metallosphaera javensis (ex Hofmann et al. 2022)]MCG3109193.1 hypothetical protein [Metallosphaera javensis (ex Hofmann et al. 2022)]
MLFSTRPKEDRRDLYDREREIDMIKESIERREWVSVIGPKRVGKTSLVNVAVKETNSAVIQVNLMRLYDPRKKQYPKEDFIRLFLESVNTSIRNYTALGKAIRIVSNILGVEGQGELDLNSLKLKARLKRLRGQDISYLLSEMNSLARDNGKKLVVVLDESQELSKVTGVNFSSIFHHVYDNCENTVIVFTGSQSRLVERVLTMEYSEPFFGRYIRTVPLGRFTRDQSVDFLERGFREEGVKVERDVIEGVVDLLDGIPGWLTLFGSEYSFGVKHGLKPNLEKIVDRATEEVKSEVLNFLEASQSPFRYSAIILALDRVRSATLNEIVKVASSILGEEIPEPRVYEMLKRLVDLEFVMKDGDRYKLQPDEPGMRGTVMAAKEILQGRE